MIYEKDPIIEELLNAYIDGELSPDEQVRVQRLIKEDKGIARRLTELERCHVLVNSLPPSEPPAHVISGIKELVRGRSTARQISIENRRGQWHLWTRHTLAASLMVGLFGLFAAVIYQINRPIETDRSVAVTQTKPAVAPKVMPTQPARVVAAEESAIGVYSLQLQTTSDFTGIDAYINKVLDNSTWLKYEAKKDNPGQSTYRVLCSRGALEALMTDLSPVWSKFNSATLVVQSANIGQAIAVEQVKPEQVTEIAKLDTIDSRVRLAKDFTLINTAERLSPDNKMLAIQDRTSPDFAIPKPVLTSGEKNSIVAPKGANDQVRVDLSIVVAGK
jgi:hypothetical protein